MILHFFYRVLILLYIANIYIYIVNIWFGTQKVWRKLWENMPKLCNKIGSPVMNWTVQVMMGVETNRNRQQKYLGDDGCGNWYIIGNRNSWKYWEVPRHLSSPSKLYFNSTKFYYFGRMKKVLIKILYWDKSCIKFLRFILENKLHSLGYFLRLI